MSFAIKITGSELALGRAAEILERPEVARIGARGVSNRIRDRFQELEETRPNKMDWPREHFWADVARSIQAPIPIGVGEMLIGINHVGAAQRFFGGVIKPIRSKFLTLPARGEAYGKRAREFDNLHFGFFFDEVTGRKRPALYEPETQGVKFGKQRKDGTRRVIQGKVTGGVFYWLTRRVVQKPDPSILPTREQMVEAAETPILEYIDREAK